MEDVSHPEFGTGLEEYRNLVLIAIDRFEGRDLMELSGFIVPVGKFPPDVDDIRRFLKEQIYRLNDTKELERLVAEVERISVEIFEREMGTKE